MKFIILILQVMLLFVFYFIGSMISTYFKLPISGSIVGMLLFLCALMLKIIPTKWIDHGSEFLVASLPFLFVPATVGVMNHLNLFKGNDIILCLLALLSTLLTIAAGGYVTHKLVKKDKQKSGEKTTCPEQFSQ